MHGSILKVCCNPPLLIQQWNLLLMVGEKACLASMKKEEEKETGSRKEGSSDCYTETK